MFKTHSPQTNCFMNTDYQRSLKFWIYVKYEQNSTERYKINSDSIVITWSVIGCWLSFSAISVTFDIVSSKTITSFPPQKILHTVHYMKSHFADLKGNYHDQRSIPGIPVMNQTHPNQTSHLFSLIRTLVFSSNQYVAAQSVLWPGYILEDLGFKSWQKQQTYLFSETSRPAPAPNQPPTQYKPELFLWQ